MPSASTAVNSGSSVAHSEPKAIASTIAAAMKPMNSLGPPPWLLRWPAGSRSRPARPAARRRARPRRSRSACRTPTCGTSAIGCSPSMCTLANATVPSLEICRAAAPFANGLSTRSTCGPSAILSSVCSIRAFVAGSLTSSAANTTWFVSVDSLLKLSVRRLQRRRGLGAGQRERVGVARAGAGAEAAEHEQGDQPGGEDTELVAEAPAGESCHLTDRLRKRSVRPRPRRS